MGKALIIGAGGVASVAIHKCCQNSEAFDAICIASRTKSKCDALKAKLDGGKTKITTAQVDADNVNELVALIEREKPDVVLVHGDTTTSMAAALAAFYRQIPVGHVEAGLRTHNIYSPWPEEMNRQITGRIATYHFSPTPLSRQNLLNEGIDPEKITVTGNTVIDALLWVVENVMEKGYEPKDPSVASLFQNDKLRQNGRRMVLITGHRRENFGEGF